MSNTKPRISSSQHLSDAAASLDKALECIQTETEAKARLRKAKDRLVELSKEVSKVEVEIKAILEEFPYL